MTLFDQYKNRNFMTFKAALIQMHVTGGDKRKNLARAIELIGQAKAQGADLALLPEAMDLGWTHPSSKTEAEAIPEGMPFQMLATAAAENQILICAGLTEADGDNVFNSAVIIDRKGQLLSKHRKLNELDIGHEFYGQGSSLSVCSSEIGKLGLMICSDGFARDCVLSRSLGYMGADVILSPCAWAVHCDHDNAAEPYGALWREAYTPVAKEFSLWIIAASNVGKIEAGPWKDRLCIGSSMTIDHNGESILQGPFGANAETILYIDVEPQARPARGDNWNAP